MKLVLVASLAAVLGMGMSGEAAAHDYGSRVGGSVYWADSGVVIGLNYGTPLVAPYYVPPRYVYRAAPARYGYWRGKSHGSHKGYKHGYRKGYKKGHKRGHGDDRWRHDRRH